MEYRSKRQVIFTAVFLLASVLAATAAYQIAKPRPTCSDGIQNQKEEGVDCGGACARTCRVVRFEDIKINSFYSFPFEDDTYDALAEIENLNAEHGLASFEYVFSFYDSEKKLIGERSGESFILAGQKRYIAESNIQLPSAASFMNFKINQNSSWQKQDEILVDLPVFSKKYEPVPSGEAGSAKVTGVVDNKTKNSFAAVDVVAVLFNAERIPFAVSKTRIDDFRPGESRALSALFYGQSASPNDFNAVAYTNIFDPVNVR